MPPETNAVEPSPNAWGAPSSGAGATLQAPLALTRRGVWLIHWGIELSAGLILLGAIFGLFLLVQRTPIAAQLVQWWFTAKTPILLFLQMMIVAGVVLLTAGPQPSRASAWTLLAVIAIGAGRFGVVRLATYLLDGPAGLVQMTEWHPTFYGPPGSVQITEWLLILYGLFYAAWAHRFCRWLASIGADDAPAQLAIRGGLTWKRLAGSMNIVFWILAIGGAPILGGFLMSLMLPFLVGGEDAMSMVPPLMATAALLMFVGLPFLVLAFLWVANRTDWINRRLKATITEPVIGPIAALPPERIGSIGLALGAIAAVGLTLGLWADQVLAPAYQARQLEATLAQLGGGDRALDLPAPEITLTPLSGPPVTLADFRGRVVMLNFYATWCRPCLAEIPSLARLSREYGEEKLVIIGISDEDAATIRGHASTRDIPYRLVSGSGWPAPFDQISAVPTTFLVDREGIIRRRIVGARPHDTFKGLIDEVMAGPAAPAPAALEIPVDPAPPAASPEPPADVPANP